MTKNQEKLTGFYLFYFLDVLVIQLPGRILDCLFFDGNFCFKCFIVFKSDIRAKSFYRPVGFCGNKQRAVIFVRPFFSGPIIEFPCFPAAAVSLRRNNLDRNLVFLLV